MFHELRLENFKGFQDSHRIPLAPITLVFGPNSAGKSAVIKALLLLAQSVNAPGRPGSETQSPPLQFSGQKVDLANFANTIYGHDVSRRLGIGLTHDSAKIPGRLAFDIEVSNAERIQLDRVTYDVIDDPTRRISFVAAEAASGSASNHLHIDRAVTTYGNVLEPYADVDVDSKKLTSKRVNKFFAEQLYPRRAFLPYDPYLVDRVEGEKRDSATKRRWRSVFKSDRLSEEEAMALMFTEMQWGAQLNKRFDQVTHALAHVSHIGPLRNVFARYQELQPGRKSYVGQGGEQTLEVLLQTDVSGVSSQFLVNEWLARLGLRYEIRVDKITPENMPLVGDLASLVIRDVVSGIDLSARDVGVGISQVIPVVVQSLIARESTLLIEQPELHLHPRMQSEIGDLLIHSFMETENQVIVETHSEHLLLRLMRRIREGQLPHHALKVVYVDTHDDGSLATVLDFDSKGRLTESWPNGFFEERLQELQ